jgi:phage baseplate assembly protein W
MAFQVKKIHPLDLQSRKAVGVSLPFSAENVFTSTYTTQEALKSNLINFILTDQGERVLNPDFGINLRKYLFEQYSQDAIEQIEYTIRKGLSDWFPEVVLNKLLVVENTDNHTISVSLKYSVPNTNITDNLLINFQQ